MSVKLTFRIAADALTYFNEDDTQDQRALYASTRAEDIAAEVKQVFSSALAPVEVTAIAGAVTHDPSDDYFHGDVVVNVHDDLVGAEFQQLAEAAEALAETSDDLYALIGISR